MKGSWPLLAAIVAVWAVVWAATQRLGDSPLSTGPTVVIGLALTLLVVWGYPSAMRGPRRLGRFGRLSAATMEAPTGDALAMVSRTLPYLRDGLTE